MPVSKIYQKAVQQGGRMLENGNVYRFRQGKKNPNMWIQQTIAPNGSYAIQLSENGVVTKRVHKTILNDKSSIVDTWDFSKKRGIHLSKVDLISNQSFMSRVFDKTGESSITSDGLIYLFRKGDPDRFSTHVTTLNGFSSVAKPFSPMGWLNDQFYKLFNK